MVGLTEQERTERVLSDLQTLFENLVKDKSKFNVRDYFTGNAYSQPWVNTPANGLAYFRTKQYSMLKTLAGGYHFRVLFAGEHLSVHHGWIIGSL